MPLEQRRADLDFEQAHQLRHGHGADLQPARRGGKAPLLRSSDEVLERAQLVHFTLRG